MDSYTSDGGFMVELFWIMSGVLMKVMVNQITRKSPY